MVKTSNNHEIEKGAEEYEEAISYTGFGRYNVTLIFICGASILTVLVETLGMAYILPSAQCDLELTISDKGIISSIGFLGVVLSSLLWGFLADTVGRKKVIIIGCFFSSLFGFASSLVSHVWLFILFRFMNGFFIGCPASIVIAYAGEFHSDKYRAKAISWMGSFVALSSFYLPTMAWLVLPMEWSVPIPGIDIVWRPWRLLIILFSLPSFLVVLCYLRYPESPKFLWSIGKSEESLNILRDMFVANTGKDKLLYPVNRFELNTKPEKIIDPASKSVGSLMIKMIKQIWDQIVPLITMPLLPNMILTSALQLGIQASAQGVFMWIPEIFNKIALYTEKYPTNSVTICQAVDYGNQVMNITNLTEIPESLECTDFVDEEVFKITLIIGTLTTIIFIIFGFVIDIVGKKLLLVIVLLASSISGFLLNFMNSYSTIVIFLCTYLITGPCINIVLTIQVELFPTEHRAKAVAISQMMGRTGALLGSLLTGLLIGNSCSLVFYIFASILLGLIIISLLLPVPLFVRKTRISTKI